MVATPAVSNCPRCERGKEIYWYMGLYEYDVDRVRELVCDGRDPVELDEDSARSSVDDSELDECHLPHVNMEIPGIIAHVAFKIDAGEELHGHVLIDGHHRAARCLREQRPFLAYILTEDESQIVLLRGPNDPIPRATVRPWANNGQYHIAQPRTGATLTVSERDYFLFLQFDGRQTAGDIRAAYEAQFGERLAQGELNKFVLHAQDQGFLESAFDHPSIPEPEAEDTSAYEQRFPRSRGLAARSAQVIAGATTHDRRDFGPYPVYVERAEGAWKWDAEGQPLIDYWMGHGALLLGHSYPPVVEAITRQAAHGTHFGACHEQEVRWAEMVCQLIPSSERVRFTASGSEATLLALRGRRAFTGRDLIVKLAGHFHGWHDEAMVHFYAQEEAGFSAGSQGSVAVASATAPREDVLALLKTEKVAAVLLEPGGGSAGGLPCDHEQLRVLREATQRHGSLLVFDEVITGFRQSPGGVQQEAGVLPDLTTLAKILCGGLPGGALVGRADVMAVFGAGTQRGARRAKVPHTGTFNGNPLSAVAGITLLEQIADGVAQQQAKAAAVAIAERVNAAAARHGVDVYLYVNGCSIYHILIGAHAAGLPLGPSPAVSLLHAAHPSRYARLRRALLLEGVDTHPVHGWVSAVHDETVIAATVAAFDRAFQHLREVEGFRL